MDEANIESLKEKYEKVLAREQHAQSVFAAIRKVRDGYADQAKFADIEAAVYFREFVRRLDEAVSPKTANPPWGGRTPAVSNGERGA